MSLTVIMIALTLSGIGLLWTVNALVANLWPFFTLIQNCIQAGRDQKMMFEWAGKNQAWCSKNQIDLEALARRVALLEAEVKNG